VNNANAPLMFKSETAFWLSRALQARFTAAWRRAVAAAMAAHTDNVLGYEILNEPPVGLIGPGVFDNAVLAPFYERNARAIRKLDPGGLIFVEPIGGSGADFSLARLSIARLVYSTHLYAASLNDAAYHAGDFAGPTQFLPDLLVGGREAARVHAAYWPGEWGYLDPTQTISRDETRYAGDMLTAQDIARVGSAYWTYNRHDPGWNPAIVSVLTRPSPFAIAGDMVSIRTKQNSLTVTWRQSGRASSRFSLPAGWTPRIQASPGATVTTAPGGWIDVTARPGSTATVVITKAN
jgi:cellulase (glycosyl hydrolase family 5)